MYEASAVWTLTGPDGTQAQFNVGGDLILEEVSGFDSATVRQNVEDLPELDGAACGDFFLGSRPITLSGRVASATAAARNATVANLQRAARGLRSEITLVSQPQGMPVMQTTARLQSLRVSGGFVKQFQLALVCADPRFYSQTLNSVSATGTVSTTGASFPWAFPVSFGGGTGGTASAAVSNAGNMTTPPLFHITGPVTNPRLTLYETGESLYVDNLTLATSGDTLDIDIWNRTAVVNSVTNVYSHIRFPDSVWWLLQPGANTVQLWASSSSAGVSLQAQWRDAWG